MKKRHFIYCFLSRPVRHSHNLYIFIKSTKITILSMFVFYTPLKKCGNLITNTILSYAMYHFLNSRTRNDLLSKGERTLVYRRLIRYAMNVYTLISIVWILANGDTHVLEYIHGLTLSYALFCKIEPVTVLFALLHCVNTYDQPHILRLLAMASFVEMWSCIPGLLSLFKRCKRPQEESFELAAYAIQTLFIFYYIWSRQLEWSCFIYAFFLPYLVAKAKANCGLTRKTKKYKYTK